MADDAATEPLGNEPFYSIGETARLAGVNQSAARLWEREGLIRPRRTPGGHRVYTSQEIERLRRIAWLRRVEKLNAAAMRRELGPLDGPPPGVDSTLGRRLHVLRETKGLSLRDLADQTGLSASLLSAVERGQSGISLPNLFKLADALGTTVPELQALYKRRGRRLVRPLERPTYVAEDKLLTIEDLIAEPSALVAQIVQIAPGRERKAEYTHPGEELIHLLCGQLSFWIDEREHYVLEAGDSLHLAHTKAHRWKNEGTSQTTLMRIILPPTDADAEGTPGTRGRRRLPGHVVTITDETAAVLYPDVDDFL